MGNMALAQRPGTIAIGNVAQATALNSVAIGNQAQAMGAGSVALGSSAQAIGDRTVALGGGAKALTGMDAVSIGNTSQAGNRTVSVGAYAGNRQTGDNNVVSGYYAGAAGTGNNNVSLGYTTGISMVGNNNSSIGYVAATGMRGDYNTSIGHAAGIESYNDVVGTGYTIAVSNSVSVGARAYTKSNNGVALGANSVAVDAVATSSMDIAGSTYSVAGKAPIASVSIGSVGTERTLTNLAAGRVLSDSTDAVNGSQLYALTLAMENLSVSGGDAVLYDSASKDRITLAGGSTGTLITNLQDGSIASGSHDAINGGQLYQSMSSLANAIGDATVNLDGRVSTNTQNISSNTQNISNNTQSINNLANSLSQGVFSVSGNGESNAVLVGQGETIDFSGSDGNIVIRQTGNDFSFGLANSISIQNSLSVGNVNISGDSLSIAGGLSISYLGINAGGTTLSGLLDGQNPDDAVTKSQLDAVIQSANTLSASVVTYDSVSKDRITLAGGSNGTVIANLQDGLIATGSSEVINGGQLHTAVSSIANAVGGGSVINADGSISAPQYILGGDTYTTIGGALSNLDGCVSSNTQNIANNTQNINTNSQNIASNTQNINNLSNSISQGTFSVSANGEGNAVAVAQGETIDFGSSDGNVVISQNGNDFGFGLARNINVGGSINIANTVSISSSGINMGGTTLTGLLDGSSPSDAVTKAQLDAVVQSANTLSASVVTYDSASKDRITLAGGSTGTLISNLQDGSVSASSQDAVSGRQLYKVSSSMANALGGGASVNADGTLGYPSYVLDGQVFSNVGGALTNLDGRVVQNTNSITQLDKWVSTVEDNVSNISNQLSQVTDNVVQYDDQAKNSVTLAGRTAQLSTNSTGDEVVMAGGTLIQNVANGVKASDAVNKGQLDASLSEAKSYTDKQISQFTDNMGADLSDLENRLAITNKNVTSIQNGASGMVQVSQTASVTQPKITGDNALAIGSGAAAEGNNSVAVGNQSQAKANNSVALGAGSIADRDNSVSVGSEGQERQLTNVAAGTHATDAVNVGQLNQALTGMAGSVNHLNQRINQVEDNANAGVAAAIAIANLPQPSGAGEGWVSMAVGGYDNQSGYALGYSATSSSGRWVFKAAATGNSQGKLGGGAGVAFRLY